MNLLPKSHQDFCKADYWNNFFKKRGHKAFEWYGEFLELSSYLFKYIQHKDKILIVGCGNSTLGMNLYDADYKNITNIDVSHIVIKQMQKMNKTIRPDLLFLQMDATKMTYNNGEFNIILDKGTLDALMANNDNDSEILINKYFEGIERILPRNGRYICISLLQEHILRKLLKDFALTFAFRIIRCHHVEIKSRAQHEKTMPIFMVILTKFMKLSQPILEIGLTDDSLVRLISTEEVVEQIIETQKAASVCNSLYKGSIANDGEIYLDLHKPGEKEPRYRVYILDQVIVKERRSYAAFIVPQGRESDWLFGTKEGRQELLKSTQQDRLAIVIFQRGQNFETLEKVKDELAESIKMFAPSELSKNHIPFLSLGSDIGKRNICYEGNSDISGPFVVEEIENENCLYRRLIFLNNLFVIQSEVKLKQVMSRRKKSKCVVDPYYLACNHHLYMSLGLKIALKNSNVGESIIIGLGGGGLCTFIRHCIPQTKIIAVEIDKTILKIAKEYFDLVEDERLKVEISDGIEYLNKSRMQGKKYDAILFDVDNKDATVGMSCPPKEFVELDFLRTINNCLTNDGLIIVNLVARNEKIRNEVLNDFRKIYKFVASYKLNEDINEIIFCYKNEKDFQIWKNMVLESAEELNKQVKSNDSAVEEIFEISSVLDNLKLES
ncbi:PREDICTED: methyltransferase-like protein 13 [Ceratosolen solmsi marchali]|uniref:Methyltransferase-like protein 13 n=1 Tax=Ceratosolen solmsi marchali TaxID=326594 RepID=A0AAJ7DX69_9HYME|nr:PREDICTED: methyltransferase-like protein 13 [Ceratosolen solmsi marchali]